MYISLEFLHHHANKFDSPKDMNPIFLYLAFQNIHGPTTTEEKFYNMHKNRKDLSDDGKVLYAYLTEADAALASLVPLLPC